jgi:hypothetical protein
MNEQSYQEKYPPIAEEEARAAMREREAVIRMLEEMVERAKLHCDIVLMREADSQLGEKLEEKQQFFDFGASHGKATSKTNQA